MIMMVEKKNIWKRLFHTLIRPEALEAAIQAALKTSSAQEAADLLLEAADSAAGHILRDDQTAVVLRLVRQLPPETMKRSGHMRTERQGKPARFTGTGC